MLLAFVVIVSLMSQLCDCEPTQCSAPSDCQPTFKHCCGGPPNGKYCSQCCVDSDCSRNSPGDPLICVPISYLFPNLPHVRMCVSSKFVASSQPCFRNEQCASMRCIGGLGFSGDKVHYPLGTCA